MYQKTCRLWYTLLLSILFAGSALGQSYHTRIYSMDEGLVQSQANAVIQDSKGYLWVGTHGGLSRFDGNTFTNFTVEDGLAGNHITAIAESQNGDLWIGTQRGISIFDGHQFRSVTTKQGLSDLAVNDLLAARDGTVWIATQKGLTRYLQDQFNQFGTTEGLPSNKITALAEGPDGAIWMGTASGIAKYKNGVFEPFTSVDEHYHGNAIYDLIVDRNGMVWAANISGVNYFSEGQWHHIGTNAGLPTNRVLSLFEDRSGGIWLGTRSGLLRFENNIINNITRTDQSWVVRSISEDREGNIWAGTSGRGLIQVRNTAFRDANAPLNLSDDVFLALYEDRKNRLWISGFENGIHILDGEEVRKSSLPIINPDLPDEHASRHVRTFLEDRRGKMWYGTDAGIIYHNGTSYTRKSVHEGLAGMYVYTMLEDDQNRVWVGSSGGINIVKGDSIRSIRLGERTANKTTYTFFRDYQGQIWIGSEQGLHKVKGDEAIPVPSMARVPVSSIRVDPLSKDLWLGTLGYGVIRVDRQSGIIKDTLTVKDGLNNSTVFFLEIGADGDLWVGTSMGVNRLNVALYHSEEKKNIRSYGKNEGIVGVETNLNASHVDHEGRLWFGTLERLLQFDATEAPFNGIPPKVHLMGLRLFMEEPDANSELAALTRPHSSGNTVILPYNKNHLSFSYEGITLTAPEQARYQYILRGFDNDWLPETRSKYATYSNLPPGDYQFEVRMRNGDGIWSTENPTLFVHIDPPFWQRTWFYLLCIFGLTAGVFGTIQWRTSRLARQHKHLESMVNARTLELKQTNEELVEAREAALASSKAKTQFIAAMTHELRTPMNGIMGMAAILNDTELDTEQKDYTETIKSCGSDMLSLIENLLTFSDLATGDIENTPTLFMLEEVLMEMANNYRGHASNKGIEILVYLAPDVPPDLFTDRDHLEQMLRHLVSNAVKFTHGGFILIEAGLEGTQLEIAVHDTGIGMTKEELKNIFEAFSQVDMSETRPYSGLGIGLAIAQQVSALTGGQLSAASRKGVGSSFFLSYSLADVMDHSTWDRLNEPVAENEPRRQVLIDLPLGPARRKLELATRAMGLLPLFSAKDEEPMVLKLVPPGGIHHHTDAVPVVILYEGTVPDLPYPMLDLLAPLEDMQRTIEQTLQAGVEQKEIV